MKENRLETEMSTRICLNKFREPLLKKIIKSMEFPVGSIELDAGCGIDFVTNLLAKTIGGTGQVIGLDLSQDCIQYAQREYQNIKFKQGDINTLPFSDNTFDFKLIWIHSSIF